MEGSPRRITNQQPASRREATGLNVEVGRVPPQAVEAERAVLGSMLLSREAISQGIENLNPECFYDYRHAKLWKVIVDLFDANSPADLVTVSEELKRRNELEAIGGISYLTSLDQFVSSPS